MHWERYIQKHCIYQCFSVLWMFSCFSFEDVVREDTNQIKPVSGLNFRSYHVKHAYTLVFCTFVCFFEYICSLCALLISKSKSLILLVRVWWTSSALNLGSENSEMFIGASTSGILAKPTKMYQSIATCCYFIFKRRLLLHHKLSSGIILREITRRKHSNLPLKITLLSKKVGPGGGDIVLCKLLDAHNDS